MPASDAVIGRVSVKVLPDTDSFRKDTERKLSAIEKSLRVEVRVEPKIDLGDFKREVDRAIRQVEELADAIEIATDLDVTGISERLDEVTRDRRVKIKLDQGARDKLNMDAALLVGSVQAQLNSIEWAPGVDRTKLARARQEIELELIKIAQLKASITPEMDAISRRRVLLQIEQLQEKCDRIKANIEPQVGKIAKAKVEATLAVLARKRIVDLSVRLSKASLAKTAAGIGTFVLAMAGLRGFRELFGSIVDSLLRLDIIAPKIGALATGIAGLGLTLIATTGNLLSFGASLATIAPLALALPGLLIGAGVGVATFVAALKDFNTIFPDVAGKFSALQDLISSKFWQRAQAPVRAFIDSVFPQLERGFAKVADTAGLFFGSLSTSIRKVLAQRLDGWFNSISAAFLVLNGYTDTFANIIGVLGTLGTKLMPRLALAFGNMSRRFSNWLTVAERTGRLNELIETAIQGVKDLGRIVGAVSSIFAGLARAAQKAGGSTLKSLADGLSGVAKVVNSPRFQQGLVKTFAAAYDAMSRIASKAGPGLLRFFDQLSNVIEDIGPKVGDTIGTALGAIADTLADPRIRKGINDLFTGVRDAVDKIAPALKVVGPAVGSILSLVGDLVDLIGDSVAQALGYVAPFIRDVAEGIRPLTKALNDPIRDIVDAIGPTLVDLGGILRSLFETVADKVTKLWDAMGPFVQKGLKEALTGVKDFIQKAADALGKIKPETVEVFGNLVGKLVELAGTVVGKTLSAIADGLSQLSGAANEAGTKGGSLDNLSKDGGILDQLIDKTNKFFNGPVADSNARQKILNGYLGDFLSDSNARQTKLNGTIFDALQLQWDFTKTSFSLGFDSLKSITSTGWDYISGSFLDGINGVGTIASTGWGILKDTASQTFSAIGTTASTGWGVLRDTTASIFGSVVTTVSTTWNSIYTSVSTAIGNAAAAVAEGVGKIVLFFQQLPGKIVTAVGNLASTLLQKGVDLVVGFFAGIINAWSSVTSFAANIGRSILNFIGDIGHTLYEAGVSIITGFISGIKSAFGAVKDTLGDLTSKLTSWKGPPKTDAVILRDAGKLVIDGFIDGLESRYDAVRESLGGLSKDIANTTLAAPTVAGITASAADIGGSAALSNGGRGDFHYHAAPGSSLGAEEDLFRATESARFFWD